MTEKTHQLERLCSNLVAAKYAESVEKAKRLQFEDAISSLIATQEEGTENVVAGSFKISVTSKLTRSLDYPAYLAVEDGLPEGIKCVDLKPSLNLKKLRALEMVDPSLSAHFITTKPAKCSVKVEATV